MADEILKNPTIEDMKASLRGEALEVTPKEDAPPADETVVADPPADETVTEDAPAEDKEKPVEPPKPEEKKKEKRFSEITRTRDEAIARAEALSAEVAELRKQSTPPPEAPKPEVLSEPDPTKFEDWDKYKEAKAAYDDKRIEAGVQKALQAARDREVQSKAEEVQRAVTERWKASEAELLDSSTDPETVKAALNEVGKIASEKNLTPLFKASEHGPAMVLELHGDPDLMKKFQALDTTNNLGDLIEASLMLGELRQRVKDRKLSEVKAPARVLPDPPKTLGGAATGVPKDTDWQKATPSMMRAYLDKKKK